MYHLETIAAIDLKVGISSEINEVIKLNEYHFLQHLLKSLSDHQNIYLQLYAKYQNLSSSSPQDISNSEAENTN